MSCCASIAVRSRLGASPRSPPHAAATTNTDASIWRVIYTRPRRVALSAPGLARRSFVVVLVVLVLRAGLVIAIGAVVAVALAGLVVALEDHEHDAPVLGAAFIGAVVGDRLAVAVALGDQPARIDAVRDQVTHDVVGALVRQAEVVSRIALVVGVALDADLLHLGVIAHDLGDLVEDALRLLGHLPAARLELDDLVDLDPVLLDDHPLGRRIRLGRWRLGGYLGGDAQRPLLDDVDRAAASGSARDRDPDAHDSPFISPNRRDRSRATAKRCGV